MIIVCPSCSARFTVDDAVMEHGRKVRCSDCKHVWFQKVGQDENPDNKYDIPSPEEVGETGVQDKSDADRGDSEELPPEDDGLDGIEENSALTKSIPSNLHPAENDDFYNPTDADAPLMPPGYDEYEDGDKPRVKATFLGVLFVLLCLSGASAAWLFGASESAVKAFPPLVRVYHAFGIETPYYAGKGISVVGLTSKRGTVNNRPVLLVRGDAVNDTDEPIIVPSMLIELKDGETVVSHWKTPNENYSLEAGESTTFEYGLPNPSARGETVTVRFAGAGDTDE